MLKVSDRYIVEIDISDDGSAHMQVLTNERGRLFECVNVITGNEAIELYNKLTKKESE